MISCYPQVTSQNFKHRSPYNRSKVNLVHTKHLFIAIQKWFNKYILHITLNKTEYFEFDGSKCDWRACRLGGINHRLSFLSHYLQVFKLKVKNVQLPDRTMRLSACFQQLNLNSSKTYTEVHGYGDRWTGANQSDAVTPTATSTHSTRH